MKRKYILMSMIAAATLASCSKDDSDNKIDNNNNSVVEVEKTVENGVKETVENSVETISCPVTITVNKGNSVSKIGVADGGLGEVFTSGDQLRVFLLDGETRGAKIGTLDLTSGVNSAQGEFSGQIQLPKSQDNTYPNSIPVTVLVSKMDSPLDGFSETVYSNLSSAVATNAYLSASATLTTSTVAENGYPSYSVSGITLTDQTAYLVISGSGNVDINKKNFTLSDGSVLAFKVGTVVNSDALGISNWTSVAGKKYTFNLSAVKSVKLNEDVITLSSLDGTATLTATIYPTTVTEKNISWSSSNNEIATVENGTVKAIAAGEATITATVNDSKTATCLVKVNPQTIKFEEGEKSLILTYYSNQTWSDLNSNDDNKNLGNYSTENGYVKILDKWLKYGENYVKATDAIQNGTYTLVSNGANSITINNNDKNYTIFYEENETWAQVAARPENAGILTSYDYNNNKYYTIGNLEVGVKDSDATKLVLGTDVVNSTQEYLLYNAVL